MKGEVHEEQNSRAYRHLGPRIYSNTTVPPAASRAALSFSASSLDTLARISWGRDSTSFLAWLKGQREKNKRLEKQLGGGLNQYKKIIWQNKIIAQA